MLGGTLITKILLSSKSLRTLSVVWTQNCHKWLGLFDFQVQGFFVLVRCMIRWTRLRISRILSHYCNFFCFHLTKSNSSGKVTFSRLLLVLPLSISCMGRNLLSKVMEIVAVIDYLSLILEIGTMVSPPFPVLSDDTCTSFNGVWLNLWLKNVELGIFQHNLRFEIIILTLLPSELQLKYAF